LRERRKRERSRIGVSVVEIRQTWVGGEAAGSGRVQVATASLTAEDVGAWSQNEIRDGHVTKAIEKRCRYAGCDSVGGEKRSAARPEANFV
jgi:hypothetical protein